MAMTSEERSKFPLCGAKKKNGEKCRAFADQHTSHLGVGPCKYHGGRTPNHNKRALKLEAERDMAASTLGRSIDVRPDQALMGVLRATAGHVAWLGAEVSRLEGINEDGAPIIIKLYGEERDRLARVAAACLDSGISKLEVEITEKQTEFITKAVDSALSSIGGLNNEQRKEFAAALRREFASVESGSSAQPQALTPCTAG